MSRFFMVHCVHLATKKTITWRNVLSATDVR